MNSENKLLIHIGYYLTLLIKQICKVVKKHFTLSKHLSIYYTWKNIKSVYKNNKFKISVPPRMINLNYQMDYIPISDIQDYFQHITKKHETFADNPPTKIYVNNKTEI